MNTVIKIIGIALFAAVLVLSAVAFHLNRGLPETEVPPLELPAAGLKFAFGSGYPEDDVIRVNEFQNGYALLSSGPVNIRAEELQTLQYSWVPSRKTGELAFFWRQKGNTSDVKRAEILAMGTAYLDLSEQVDWDGEIVEVGFVVAGEPENPVGIGELVLLPTDFSLRAKLAWQDWTTYELRSQQSINFLQGGAHNQTYPLPLLVIAWLFITLFLVRVFANKLGIQDAGTSFFPLAVTLFLAGWMLLDIRWTINSGRSASELLTNAMSSSPDQRAVNDLDGEIFKYVQRLKNEIIQPDNDGESDGSGKRILILGDESAVDYFLLRSKYHLLPFSAHVAGRFDSDVQPQSLDYVIYFGQQGTITDIPGWTSSWRNALKEVDRSVWGTVYQIQN